jgi:CelD/BcsL family acetyltransferase involved in cellulose biosynthesis
MHWIELGSELLAVEYQLAGGGTVYHYLSGINPDYLGCEPGRVANAMTLRWAIEHGYREFDFLRGDEPYKASWGVEPRPSVALRIVPPRAAAQFRQQAWLATQAARGWARRGLQRIGLRASQVQEEAAVR